MTASNSAITQFLPFSDNVLVVGEMSHISKVLLQLLKIIHELPSEYRAKDDEDTQKSCHAAMVNLDIIEPLDIVETAIYIALQTTKLSPKGYEFVWKLHKAKILA